MVLFGTSNTEAARNVQSSVFCCPELTIISGFSSSLISSSSPLHMSRRPVRQARCSISGAAQAICLPPIVFREVSFAAL